MNYIHGGSPEYYLDKFGLKKRKIIDFSININPLGPPESVKMIWKDLLEKVAHYPSINGEGVRKFYKNRFHLPSEFILPGNGSTELIYLLPRVLSAEKILIIKPSYFDYERACRLAGKKVISLYMDPYKVDKKDIMHKLIKADALWIGRPNNPTGNLIRKEIIEEIIDLFPKKWIILDEAFIQFVKEWEKETFISTDIPENVFVIHSLTKFYALPGIRIGALISRPENISVISKKKEPWTVNIIAEEIAKNLYPCHEYEKKTVSVISSERERLFNILSCMNEIEPVPSETNFILCRYKKGLDHLLRHLLRQGVFVRDCRNFDGLSGNFFRIGIKTYRENEILISSLSSL